MKRLLPLLLMLSSVLSAAHVRPATAGPFPNSRDSLHAWQPALIHPHAPGELLVQYERGQAERPRGKAAQTLFASMRAIEGIPDLSLHRYVYAGDLAQALSILNADPGISFAEPNYLLVPDLEPNDPFYVNFAANDAISTGGYLNRLGMVEAWDVTTGHPTIIVAVVDSGIDLDHEDLQGAIWRNPGEIPNNQVDDDANGYVDDVFGWDFAAERPDVNDWLGHGSHVAGIIAARINNAKGIAGIAPNVRVMAVNVFSPSGYGTFADEIEAILYATDQGAKVINLSLGSNAYSRGEQQAVEYAVRRGVVVVAAAGNDGRTLYHWPAAHEAAIAVAGTTARDAHVTTSNRGAFVDIAAPGEQIWSLNQVGSYTVKDGTSMAAPHVSGIAALLLSHDPTLSPIEVRRILEHTAADLGLPGWDDVFGFGRVDALAALQSIPPYTGTWPSLSPDWLDQSIWPPSCSEAIADGGFEADQDHPWHLTGSATIARGTSSEGTYALRLARQPGDTGTAMQRVHLPPDLHAASLAFAFRIENSDFDFGDDPLHPGRDKMRVWLRDAEGMPLLELLRAGNADFPIHAGLAWDRYHHVLSDDEIEQLRHEQEIQIWFEAANSPDNLPTIFSVDAVRLCISHRPTYLPFIRRN